MTEQHSGRSTRFRVTRKAYAVARDVVAVAREKQVSVLAAGLAYYAFNSLIPAAILAFLAVTTFGEHGTVSHLVASVTGVSAAKLAEATRTVTDGATGRFRAFAIAGVIFLWSTVRLFEAIQGAFTEVYGTDPYDSYPQKFLDVGIAFGTVLAGLLLVLVVGVSLVNVIQGLLWRLVSPLLLFVSLFVVFVPMYYLFPHDDVSIREVLPGAAFAAVTWAVSAVALRLYATTSSSVQLYGVAGGVLLLLTWMYVAGLALLVGTILNAVLADRGVASPD